MRRQIAFFGLFLALSLVLSYVESLIPFGFGIPGIKLGLPNLIVVLCLFLERPAGLRGGKKMASENVTAPEGEPAGFVSGTAMLLNTLRILLSGFMFGNLFSILYSFSGAALSYVVMRLFRRMGAGVIPVSVAGGIFHNLGQLLMAMAVLGSVSLIWYFLPLFLSGLVTGALIGMLAVRMLPFMKSILREQQRGGYGE